jgi:hypothetical protein
MIEIEGIGGSLWKLNEFREFLLQSTATKSSTVHPALSAGLIDLRWKNPKAAFCCKPYLALAGQLASGQSEKWIRYRSSP